MVNKARGELEIQLGGKAYTLAPTVSSIFAIEEAAGMGIGGLAARFLMSDIGLKGLSAVIYGGMLGGLPDGATPPLTFDEVAELVRKEGLARFIKPCGAFILECCTGDEKEEDKIPGEALSPAEPG